MKLEIAKEIADRIVALMAPYCGIINIAGSIRREKPDVKDIEIVALPYQVENESPNGFFTETVIGPSLELAGIIDDIGMVLKGQLTGRYMQIELNEGIKLDLFLPQSHDYYRQFAIRTGSADYSGKVIASKWVRNGWVGTSDGLRLATECEKKSSGWKCLAEIPTLPPVWESEKAFFEWLGIGWVEPKFRNV
jgi:DNA polymerase/3'-5' exonuclease PolX